VIEVRQVEHLQVDALGAGIVPINPDYRHDEVAYLLETRLGADAEVRFLGDLAAGKLIAESVRADWIRIAELVAAYRDLPLGTVDASVVATAERLRLVKLATLDRWHFTVVLPSSRPCVRDRSMRVASSPRSATDEFE